MENGRSPVEIKEYVMPQDEIRGYINFGDNKSMISSGGFVNALFLVAVMVTCFMWGMLVVTLR